MGGARFELSKIPMKLAKVMLLLFNFLSAVFTVPEIVERTLWNDLGVDVYEKQTKQSYQSLAISLEKPGRNDTHRLFALSFIIKNFPSNMENLSKGACKCITVLNNTFENASLKNLLPEIEKGRFKFASIGGSVLMDLKHTIERDLNSEKLTTLEAINFSINHIDTVTIHSGETEAIELAKDLVFLKMRERELNRETFFERLYACETLHSSACYTSLFPGDSAILMMHKFSIFQIYFQRFKPSVDVDNFQEVKGFLKQSSQNDESVKLEAELSAEPFISTVLIRKTEEFSQKCQRISNLASKLDLKRVQSLEIIGLFNELGCFKNSSKSMERFLKKKLSFFDLTKGPWVLFPELILKAKLENKLVLSLPYVRVKSDEQLSIVTKFLGQADTFFAFDGYFITDSRIILPTNLFSLYSELFCAKKKVDNVSKLIAVIRMRQILYRMVRDSINLIENVVQNYRKIIKALFSNIDSGFITSLMNFNAIMNSCYGPGCALLKEHSATSSSRPEDYFKLAEYIMMHVDDIQKGRLLSAELLSTFQWNIRDVPNERVSLVSNVIDSVFDNVFPLFPEEKVLSIYEDDLLKDLMTCPTSSYFAEWLMGPIRHRIVTGPVDHLFIQYFEKVAAVLPFDVEQSLKLLELSNIKPNTDFERVVWILKSNSLASEAEKLPRKPFSGFFKSVHRSNKKIAASFSDKVLKDFFCNPSEMVRNHVNDTFMQITNIDEREILIKLVKDKCPIKYKWEFVLELFRQYPLSNKLLDTFPFEQFGVKIEENVFSQIENCKENKHHECFLHITSNNTSLGSIDDWIDEFALGKLKYYSVQDNKTITNVTKSCLNGTQWTGCSVVCTKIGWKILKETCSSGFNVLGAARVIDAIVSDRCGPEWNVADRIATLREAGCTFSGYSEVAIFNKIKSMDIRSFHFVKMPETTQEMYLENLSIITDTAFFLPYLKLPMPKGNSSTSDSIYSVLLLGIELIDGYILSSSNVIGIPCIKDLLEFINSTFDDENRKNELQKLKKLRIIALVRARILLNQLIKDTKDMGDRLSLLELSNFHKTITKVAKQDGKVIKGLLDFGNDLKCPNDPKHIYEFNYHHDICNEKGKAGNKLENFIESLISILEKSLDGRQKLLLKAEILAVFKPRIAPWMMPIFNAVLDNYLPAYGEPPITYKDLKLFVKRPVIDTSLHIQQVRSLATEVSVGTENLKRVSELIGWMVQDEIVHIERLLPNVTKSLQLRHTALKGDKMNEAFLVETVNFIDKDPNGFISQNFFIKIEGAIDCGGPRRNWIMAIQQAIGVKKKMLLRSKVDVEGNVAFIPEWFTGRKAGYYLGAIYSKSFTMERLSPYYTLSPELIDLVIQQKYLAVIDSFYDHHYPVERVAKMLFTMVDVNKFIPTDFLSVSPVFANPLGATEQIDDAKYLNDIYQIGRLHFHDFVAGFKEGLSLGMRVENFQDIYPWKTLYDIFTRAPLTFDLVSQIISIDGEDIEIPSLVPGKMVSIKMAICDVFRAMNEKELQKMVWMITGAPLISTETTLNFQLAKTQYNTPVSSMYFTPVTIMYSTVKYKNYDDVKALFSAKSWGEIKDYLFNGEFIKRVVLEAETEDSSKGKYFIGAKRMIEIYRRVADFQVATLNDGISIDPFDERVQTFWDGPLPFFKISTCNQQVDIPIVPARFLTYLLLRILDLHEGTFID